MLEIAHFSFSGGSDSWWKSDDTEDCCKYAFNHLVRLFFRWKTRDWIEADCCHTQKPISLTWCASDAFVFSFTTNPKNVWGEEHNETKVNRRLTHLFFTRSHDDTLQYLMSRTKHLHNVTPTRAIALPWTICRKESCGKAFTRCSIMSYENRHRYFNFVLPF